MSVFNVRTPSQAKTFFLFSASVIEYKKAKLSFRSVTRLALLDTDFLNAEQRFPYWSDEVDNDIVLMEAMVRDALGVKWATKKYIFESVKKVLIYFF